MYGASHKFEPRKTQGGLERVRPQRPIPLTVQTIHYHMHRLCMGCFTTINGECQTLTTAELNNRGDSFFLGKFQKGGDGKGILGKSSEKTRKTT